MRALSDSVHVTTNETICSAAVTAYNQNLSTPVPALYVAVVPGKSYVVMPQVPGTRLGTITWYSVDWSGGVAFEP